MVKGKVNLPHVAFQWFLKFLGSFDKIKKYFVKIYLILNIY